MNDGHRTNGWCAAAGAACAALLGPAAVCADDGPDLRLTEHRLSLDMSAAYQPEPEAPKAESPPTAPSTPRPGFGRSGSQCWTIGTGWAFDLRGSNDLNLYGAYSLFVADELELALEVGGWYFNQPGQDTGGINGSMVFRWHFWHDKDYDWTVYSDVGIGFLAALDEVPDGGTGFNFTPRAGFGYTKAIGQEWGGGARWLIGLRWAHVSNGRILGDSRNPARESVMVYTGIIFPF